MRKLILFAALTFLILTDASGEVPTNTVPTNTVRWFRSNSSGMALEYVPSQMVAQRNEFSLSIQTINNGSGFIPGLILPYYDDSFAVELRTLFERGREPRRQWIFRDTRNTVRLTASGSEGLFDEANDGDESKTGFIEIRNSEAQVVREIRFESDLSQWEFHFTYDGETLLSVDTLFKDPESENPEEFALLSTDHYFYSRSGSIRAIERMLHEGAGDQLSRLAFPRIGGSVPPGEGSIFQGLAYTSAFLQNVSAPDGATISYTLDSRGRVLNEVWKDEDGEILGEFNNTWSVDRLLSVLWTSPDDERLVEYDYDDSGQRVTERNFRRGVLERMLSYSGGMEVEELFMNGRLVLRALWEDGIKISEERVFPEGAR